MKERFEKVKDYIDENRGQVTIGAFMAASYTIGILVGRWSAKEVIETNVKVIQDGKIIEQVYAKRVK